jgi:hypothetical protein
MGLKTAAMTDPPQTAASEAEVAEIGATSCAIS